MLYCVFVFYYLFFKQFKVGNICVMFFRGGGDIRYCTDVGLFCEN